MLILYLIDQATRISAATFLKSKHWEKIVSLILNIWISIFGAPSKIFSDNDSDFGNEDYSEMCESWTTFCSRSFEIENPIPEY